MKVERRARSQDQGAGEAHSSHNKSRGTKQEGMAACWACSKASFRVESQRAGRVQDKISDTSVKDFLSKGEDSCPSSEKGCLMGTPP